MVNFPWLLWGTLTIVLVAAQGVQIRRNGQRKRRAHALRGRAIDAQGWRVSTESMARERGHSQCGAKKDSYTERHV